MKIGFYGKLAWSGIKKNRQLYIPYIITCIVMISMSYIVSFLSKSETIMNMRGGDSVCMTLGLGINVILIFSVIFLFYTNSFLMRKRKKEFGLYNILGMNKKNICQILFWEMMIYCVISYILGIIFGITLSKLAELILINVVSGGTSLEFTISWGVICSTAVKYAVIFSIILLCNLVRIRFVNPIELLRSENVGEKPPKSNWFVGILGLVILVAAYCIAVSVENPIDAMTWFFVAVIMVIAATYLLFIAGSVVMCRALQKNKKYYYKPNHFVSVSSMVYRMKRNGAGLASICILSTMVLVIMSTTSSMYYGAEDTVNRLYTRDMAVTVGFGSYKDYREEDIVRIKAGVAECLAKYNLAPDDIKEQKYTYIAGRISDNVYYGYNGGEMGNNTDFSDLSQICVLSLDDYNAVNGISETLNNDEIMMYISNSSKQYQYDTFEINGGGTYKVKKSVEKLEENRNSINTIFKTYYIITPDPLNFEDKLNTMANEDTAINGDNMSWYYGFNIDSDEKTKNTVYGELREVVKECSEAMGDDISYHSYQVDFKDVEKNDFYGMNGGLLFLGIMLSIVFLFAAVLIIYYKQISEGYEDRHRFVIMKKVGMNNREIRKCINSQLLTVFFLPIVMAALHLVFAFPMLKNILMIMFMADNIILIVATFGTLAVFAVGYTVVYYATSRLYYKIVNG